MNYLVIFKVCDYGTIDGDKFTMTMIGRHIFAVMYGVQRIMNAKGKQSVANVICTSLTQANHN